MRTPSDLVQALLPDDPRDEDGCCRFCRACGCWLGYEAERPTVLAHRLDCVWMEAMEFLGLQVTDCDLTTVPSWT